MQYYLNDKKLNKIEKQKAEKDGSPEEWIKIAKWCQKEDIKNKLLK